MSSNSKMVKQNTSKKSEKTTLRNKKQQTSQTARSSRSDALSPVALGSGQSILPPSRVTEEFRWGEFSDNGSTLLDGPNTFNQILFSVPVNPRRILSFAKTNTIGSTDPMIYKSEPEIQNSYQYEIDSCSIRATCVVPNTVSFTLALFITPNLESVIDPTSVMNIYASLPSSAKREISIKGDINLTFRSGRAYIKDDPLDSQFDPRLCFGGYIVGFIKAPCVAGLASDDSRAYLGPICTVSLQSSITYYGFQYNGSLLDSPQLFTAVESEVSVANNGYYESHEVYQYLNANVPTAYTVPACVTMVCVNIPDELETAVLAGSTEQQQRGEIVGSTGDHRSVVTPLYYGPRPSWEAIPNDSLGVSFEEMSRSSIVDGLKSAFAYIKDIPNQLKAGLVGILGKDAGNTVYKVGSNLALLGLKALTGLRSETFPVPASPYGGFNWTERGAPSITVIASLTTPSYRAPTSWWILPGSALYNEAIDALPVSQRSVAQALIDDPSGPQPMLWSQCLESYTTDSTAHFIGGPAYVGRTGIVSFWEQVKPSGAVVKTSFGQPLDVDGGHQLIEPRIRSSRIDSFSSRHTYKQLRRKRYGTLILTCSSSPPFHQFTNGDIDFTVEDLPASLLYQSVWGSKPMARFYSARLSDMSDLSVPGIFGDLEVISNSHSAAYASFIPRSAATLTGVKPNFPLPLGEYLIEFSYFSEHDESHNVSLIQGAKVDFNTPTSDPYLSEDTTPNHLERDSKLPVADSNPLVKDLGRRRFI